MKVLLIIALPLSVLAMPLDVQARRLDTSRFNNGPIVITGPIECEKKLVQKCHWEGNRKICVWVPSDECEMY